MTVSEIRELVTRAEASAILGVDPQTVTRWSDSGRIWHTRTLGGHRRYDAGELRTLAAVREHDKAAQEYGPVHAVMSCGDCPQKADGPAGDIQMLAAMHADETGHVVQVTASQVITYRPAERNAAA